MKQKNAVAAVHMLQIFGSFFQSKAVEARSSFIMMIVIVAVDKGFFICAKISRVRRNSNFYIFIFMKDSLLAFGRRKSFYGKICSMLISASAIVIMYYTFIEEMKQT